MNRNQFELENFIAENVTLRQESLFQRDIDENSFILKERIYGKSFLVIGGAGSIGSSFIKAILRYEPETMVVVDINENALAELTRDLRSNPYINLPKDFVTYPFSYDSEPMLMMMDSRPTFDYVANFAAHKHVRSEKDIYSIRAMLENNLFRARDFLELLSENPPKSYFCVSTDKAANPVNIMGATKRIMEDMIFSYSEDFPVNTARFANVAFSNGSLPESFLKRMEKLQPLVAPGDVKRYFVSPRESGEICMLAMILGKNREIFYPLLRKEQMMGFDTIGKKLICAKGYEPYICCSEDEALRYNGSGYPIYITGSDTCGEKKYEEFFVDGEKTDENRFLSLGVIIDKPIVDKMDVFKLYSKLTIIFDKKEVSKNDIIKEISSYLKNFSHIETGKNLDSKM